MTSPETATVKEPAVHEDLAGRAKALLAEEATAKRLGSLEDIKGEIKIARARTTDAAIKKELAAVLDRVLEAISKGYDSDTGHRWPR